jgi:hypothetical protein
MPCIDLIVNCTVLMHAECDNLVLNAWTWSGCIVLTLCPKSWHAQCIECGKIALICIGYLLYAQWNNLWPKDCCAWSQSAVHFQSLTVLTRIPCIECEMYWIWFALTWPEWLLYWMDLECIEYENLGLYSVPNAKISHVLTWPVV